MKTRIFIFYIVILLLPVISTLNGQTAVLTSSFTTESEVRINSNTIRVTLTGDTLISEIAIIDADADTFLAGFSGGSNAFNSMIEALDASNITLSADNLVADITVPANDTFFIDAHENVSFTVPAASLVSGALPIAASGSITISNEDPVISVVSETYNEADIRSGPINFTISVQGDEFVDSPGAALTDQIVSGGQWDTDITPNLGFVRNDAVTLTVTIPQTPGFEINASETVTVTIAAAYLKHTGSGNFTASNEKTITRITPTILATSDPDPIYETDLDGAYIFLDLTEDYFKSGINRNNFSLDATSLGLSIGIQTISRISDSRVRLTMNFPASADLDNNHNIRAIALSSALEGGQSVTGSPIPVIALLEPVITAVTIPDATIGIDQIVTATITVEDDRGEVFDSIAGTIAGRDVILNSLTRDPSGTEYTVDFLVEEGIGPQYLAEDSIPVVNLQMFNDTTPGNIFSSWIKNDHDRLDNVRPVISLVSLNNGKHSIGESFTITVQSNETGLTFAGSTTVNTVSLGSGLVAYEAGNGLYQLTYTVTEGNPDVFSPAAMPINVVLQDQVLNPSSAETTYTGAHPEIDAHRPAFISVDETSTGTLTPGETLVHTIVAGEDNLVLGSNTMVNNVGISSGRLTLIPTLANTYELEYVIGSGDDPVDGGQLNIIIELVDDFGNNAFFGGTVSNKDVSIVTSTPSASIISAGDVCEGDSAELIITPSGGTPPYTVTLYENDALHSTKSSVTGRYRMKVMPQNDAEYRIEWIRDALSVTALRTDSVDVLVHPAPVVSFAFDTRTSFAYQGENPYPLEANPSGGYFSGPGVVPSDGTFHPELVGNFDSVTHVVLSYTFQESTFGCVGTDTIRVEVRPESNGITILSPDPGRENIICYDDPQFLVQGYNSEGSAGSFQLFRINRSSPADTTYFNDAIIEDPVDNQAFINPVSLGLNSGSFRISYKFINRNGFEVSFEKDFEFDYVPGITFSKFIRDTVCKDQGLVSLEASPNVGRSFLFTGKGITGNEILGYSFDPQLGDIGQNTITYEFVSNAGCSRSDDINILVYDVPQVSFTPQDFCVPPVNEETGTGGGPIGFINETTKPELVSRWMWEFDDIKSNEANYDTIPGDGTLKNVVHDFTSPGRRTVQLRIETYEGCLAGFDSEIDFASKPTATYRVKSDCWIPGEPVQFINTSEKVEQWESFSWQIRNKDRTWDTTFVTLDTLTNIYFDNSRDTFEVALIVANFATQNRFCYDTVSDLSFELKPTQNFEGGADERYMTFDMSGEKWTVDSTGDRASWTWGLPDFNGFEPEFGDNAWFTSKAASAKENSWIQSECFDMRGLERPMIRMDIMKSFDGNRDGAILQYSLNNGESWTRVGDIDDGINWYNVFNIQGQPGATVDNGVGSPIGWSGEGNVFSPDTNWVTVAHDLDMIKGASPVIFGIFYATPGGSLRENQGIAVDNIYIGERKKTALIEHFTNAGQAEAIAADDSIDGFVDEYSLEVVSIQYHMHYGGEDPMNANNPSPASARSFYYGINEVPFALLDGGVMENTAFDFGGWEDPVDELDKLTLENPFFRIILTMQLGNDGLTTHIRSIALQDIDSTGIDLNVAVLEKVVSGYTGKNGDTEFRNVVLDMLPTPAGTLFARSWNKGDEEKRTFRWDYKYMEDQDYDELMIVAFLQDSKTGKILQVAAAENSEYPMAVQNHHVKELSLYPNPSRSVIYVDHAGLLTSGGIIEITDMTGRIMQKYRVVPGEQVSEIQLHDLSPGTYLLTAKGPEGQLARSSFIKTD